MSIYCLAEVKVCTVQSSTANKLLSVMQRKEATTPRKKRKPHAEKSPVSSIFLLALINPRTPTQLGSPVRDWSVEDVATWLKEIGFPQYADLFTQVIPSHPIPPQRVPNNREEEMTPKK